jgi:archaellum component FlaF (FlaF/FlaG flagellin family)
MAAVAMAWSVLADVEPVVVTNYNWLQLAPGAVQSFVGKPGEGNTYLTDGSTRANGQVADVRWGNHVWIPSAWLTDSGQGTYWAGVTLDKPRNVTSVNVLLWHSGTEQTKQFFIDAYVNGTWIEIGASNLYETPLSSHQVVSVGVEEGYYDRIRVRFDGGDDAGYVATGSYGGPGVYAVEPIGSQTLLPGDRVNWANKPSFNTTITHSLATAWSAPTNLNNGIFWNHAVSGADHDMTPAVFDELGAYVSGEYIQIDLGAVREIDNVTTLFHTGYAAGSFNVWVSEDGLHFAPVTFLEGTGTYMVNNGECRDALSFDIVPVEAQFVRLTDVTRGGSSHWGLTQILVNGTVVPEPATMSLLAMGAMTLLRRRR